MKYMLTVQHENQKVAYIEFTAENDELAKTGGENLFRTYKSLPNFIPLWSKGVSGNFTGAKPAIKNHHVSKWILSETATNANGVFCGGYWAKIS